MVKSWFGKNWHDFLHIILLTIQILATIWISYSAYLITQQNAELQRALYDFEPRVSISADQILVRGFSSEQTVVNAKVVVISPHLGSYTIEISKLNFFETYFNSSLDNFRQISMLESVNQATYPQVSEYSSTFHLKTTLFVYPFYVLQKEDLKVGSLGLKLTYLDAIKNISYYAYYDADIWFRFAV